jgi:hypothetical protein
VVGCAADAETVEDDEFLQVGGVAYLALLEGSAGLDGDAQRIVERAVAACNGSTVGAVGVGTVVGGLGAVAAAVVAVVLRCLASVSGFVGAWGRIGRTGYPKNVSCVSWPT